MEKYVRLDTIQNSEVVFKRLQTDFQCECNVLVNGIVAIKNMSLVAYKYLQENIKTTPIDPSIPISNTSELNNPFPSCDKRIVELHKGLSTLFQRPVFISFLKSYCKINIEYNTNSLPNQLELSGYTTSVLQACSFIESMNDAFIDARENECRSQEVLEKLYSFRGEGVLPIPNTLIKDIVRYCAPECLVVLLRLLTEMESSSAYEEPDSKNTKSINARFQERALTLINPSESDLDIHGDLLRKNSSDEQSNKIAQLQEIISVPKEKTCVPLQPTIVDKPKSSAIRALSEEGPQTTAKLEHENLTIVPSALAKSSEMKIRPNSEKNSPMKNKIPSSREVSKVENVKKFMLVKRVPPNPRAPSVDSTRIKSKIKNVTMPLKKNPVQNQKEVTAPSGISKSSNNSPERTPLSSGQWFAEDVSPLTKSSSSNSQIVSENEPTKNLRTVISAPALEVDEYKNRRRRPVIIDGQNVAYGMKANAFSPEAIVYAVNYFQERGHDHITVIIPAWAAKFKSLQQLYEDNLLRYVPKRVINNERQECHDDLCVLQTAMAVDGVILSNDQFRKETTANTTYKEFVEKRLLMYYFSGKTLIIPEQVHGESNPKLSEILCFPSEIETEQQPTIKSREVNIKVSSTVPDNGAVAMQSPMKIELHDKQNGNPEKIPHTSTNSNSEIAYPRRSALCNFIKTKQMFF